MKHKTLIFSLTIAVSAIALTAVAQSRSTEGVSRQIKAIQNMLKSFADDIRPRITTLEGDFSDMQDDIDDIEDDIEDLQDREDLRTACLNRSGNTSIYWPRHPEANSKGCVSHEDLGGDSDVGQGCGVKTVKWTDTHRGRTISCSGKTVPTPDGISITVLDPATDYHNLCWSAGTNGRAKFTCKDGKYVMVKGSAKCYQEMQRSHSDCH